MKRLPFSLLLAILAGFIAHACLNPQPTPPHDRGPGSQVEDGNIGSAATGNANAASATSGGEPPSGTSGGVSLDSGASTATTGGMGGGATQGGQDAFGGAAGAGGEAGSPLESP